MKAHTSKFKENISLLGRELDSKITYTIDEEEIELGKEDLNSITPSYEGNILKSVMKQLDIDSNVEIPVGTVLNYQFGVLVDDEYEYIDFGNYIVKEVEKQEDTRSWKITCYDKMLYSMKEYEKMEITYPITIRDYIIAICNHLDIDFANTNDTFANYDKQIASELYLSYNEEEQDYVGKMGYTFRDVLDELAEVTASTICINDDDELEIRYINKNEVFTPFEIYGSTTQNTTDGINLLPDYKKSNGSSNGIDFTYNSDGSYTIDGQNNGNNNSSLMLISQGQEVLVLPAGTYYTVPITSEGVTLTLKSSTGTYYNFQLDRSSITFNSETTIVSAYLQIRKTNTTIYEDFVMYPIIATREITADDFEKYTYGKTPNSYNPQDIITLTGITTLEINEEEKSIDLGNLELCKFGEYQDKIYYNDGKWYKHKEIDKVVFNGSENDWGRSSILTNTTAYQLNTNINYDKTTGNSAKAYVNYFSPNADGYSTDEECFWFNNNGYFRLRINTEKAETLEDFETWLSTHNVEVYYPLITPITEEITDDALLEQLNNLALYIDIINEEYLKDVNVDFGEKYGPVNTIILSRAEESDNIYYPETMEEGERIAIKIKDNQIMNGLNRDEFIVDIYNKLNGLEYYITDYSSTGVCYYNLCDTYKVKIGDNAYKCIMLNDEVNITQGLEENIYCNIPDDGQLDYSKADTTDIRLNTAYIMVDKANKRIDSVVKETIDGDNPNSLQSKLSQTTQTVEAIQNIFQITGGSNLIKNSQFLYDDPILDDSTTPKQRMYWLFTNNGSNPYNNLGNGYDINLLGNTTSISKIQIRDTIIETTKPTSQTVRGNIIGLKIGQTYTLNYAYNQDELTETRLQLLTEDGEVVKYYIKDEETGIITEEDLDKTYSTQETSYKKETFQFVAQASNYVLKVTTATTNGDITKGYFYLYDLMLNSGDKKNWEPAVSEVYSTVLKMSQLGLTVYATGSNTITLMNSMGFKVYKSNDGNIGEVVTEFTDEGLITNKAKTNLTYTGRYVLTELTINGKEHHVEYFEEGV